MHNDDANDGDDFCAKHMFRNMHADIMSVLALTNCVLMRFLRVVLSHRMVNQHTYKSIVSHMG